MAKSSFVVQKEVDGITETHVYDKDDAPEGAVEMVLQTYWDREYIVVDGVRTESICFTDDVVYH